jgi:hypothetical protein
VALDAGRVALAGSTRDVLGDPSLDELGVSPPAPIRLARLAAKADLPQAAARRLDEALAS